MTRRYLIFNRDCAVCNSLAHGIETLANGKIQILGLDSNEAKGMLDQAFPGGWIQQPYFVTVTNKRVKAAVRYGIVVKLGLVLGPRKSWQAYRLARSYSVALSGEKKTGDDAQ